jgi:hypothetical protein
VGAQSTHQKRREMPPPATASQNTGLSNPTTPTHGSKMANENTILLSIYLLGPNDILHTTSKDDNVPQRATLYTRLSSACTVINQHLTSQAGLWNCGGDGLIFGVHCNDNQTELEQAHDTDDWQNHHKMCNYTEGLPVP